MSGVWNWPKIAPESSHASVSFGESRRSESDFQRQKTTHYRHSPQPPITRVAGTLCRLHAFFMYLHWIIISQALFLEDWAQGRVFDCSRRR